MIMKTNSDSQDSFNSGMEASNAAENLEETGTNSSSSFGEDEPAAGVDPLAPSEDDWDAASTHKDDEDATSTKSSSHREDDVESAHSKDATSTRSLSQHGEALSVDENDLESVSFRDEETGLLLSDEQDALKEELEEERRKREEMGSFLNAVLTQEEQERLLEEIDREQKRTWRVGVFCSIIVAILIGIILWLLLGRNPNAATPAPKEAPSLAPSAAPSLAPTVAFELPVEYCDTFGEEFDNNRTTYFCHASRWMEVHPDLRNMEEWEKVQLYALACIFYAMKGPNWPKWHREIPDQWLLYDTDACSWMTGEFGDYYGEDPDDQYNGLPNPESLPCNDEGEFQSLVLSHLELGDYDAFVPSEIALLTSLTRLALPMNKIHSPVEDFLPSEIYQLTNMTSLNFHHNFLKGAIPTELSLLTDLELIYLHNNGFNGTIPTELGLLTSTGGLSLHDNALTGPIPKELGQMTSTSVLYLHTNILNSTIPLELALLTNIEVLALYKNGLTGNIPSQFGVLANMNKFHLYGNSLTGRIPTELGQMRDTSVLMLRENQLTGTIPTELGLLTNMEILTLYSNALTGTIPSELGLLPGVTHMLLNNNTLMGTIPKAINALVRNDSSSSLYMLTLEDNILAGNVSEGLCSLGFFNKTAYELKLVPPAGLSFDCNIDKLCGCDWCACDGSPPSQANGNTIMIPAGTSQGDFNNTRNITSLPPTNDANTTLGGSTPQGDNTTSNISTLPQATGNITSGTSIEALQADHSVSNIFAHG